MEVYLFKEWDEFGFQNEIIFDSHKSAINAAMDTIINCINDFDFDDMSPKLTSDISKIITNIQSGNFGTALSDYSELPTKEYYQCIHTFVSVSSVTVKSQSTLKVMFSAAAEESAEKVIKPQQAEAPCPHCLRLNDVGVGFCWCCGKYIP